MEEEALFLFIAFILEAKKAFVHEDCEIRPQTLVIKRVCLQRKDHPGERYKRLRVDFDPLNKKMAYLVYCLVDNKEGHVIVRDMPRFAEIVENLDKAKDSKAELEKGKYRDYIEHKDNLRSVEIVPVIIQIN